MREIKFRAFDGNKMRYDVTGFEHGHKNEMAGIFLDGDFYLINETGGHSPASMALNPSADVMQYTGLKDKNGVEIYEGDLIKNESGRVAKVVWNEYLAQFDCEPVMVMKGDDSYGFKNNQWHRCVKVIGNLYENKELLK